MLHPPKPAPFYNCYLIAIAISEKGARSKNHFSEQLSCEVYNIVIFESPILFRKVSNIPRMDIVLILVLYDMYHGCAADQTTYVSFSYENQGDIAMSVPVWG